MLLLLLPWDCSPGPVLPCVAQQAQDATSVEGEVWQFPSTLKYLLIPPIGRGAACSCCSFRPSPLPPQAGRHLALPGEPGQSWSHAETFRLSHLGGSYSRSKREDKCLPRDYDVLSLPCLLQTWDETFSVEHMQCRE